MTLPYRVKVACMFGMVSGVIASLVELDRLQQVKLRRKNPRARTWHHTLFHDKTFTIFGLRPPAWWLNMVCYTTDMRWRFCTPVRGADLHTLVLEGPVCMGCSYADAETSKRTIYPGHARVFGDMVRNGEVLRAWFVTPSRSKSNSVWTIVDGVQWTPAELEQMFDGRDVEIY